MSWTTFNLLYLGAMILAALGAWRLLRGQGKRLARTLLASGLLLLLGDSIAEERGLWLIPRHAEILLLSTPVENLLVVAATLLNSLLLFLLVDSRRA